MVRHRSQEDASGARMETRVKSSGQMLFNALTIDTSVPCPKVHSDPDRGIWQETAVV